MCSIFRCRFNFISVYVCVTVQLNSFILVSVFYVKILWITRYINHTISSWAIGVSIFLIDFRYYNCNADFSCFFHKEKKERKRIKFLLKKLLSNSIPNHFLLLQRSQFVRSIPLSWPSLHPWPLFRAPMQMKINFTCAIIIMFSSRSNHVQSDEKITRRHIEQTREENDFIKYFTCI